MHILAGLIEEWTRAGKETMGRVWDFRTRNFTWRSQSAFAKTYPSAGRERYSNLSMLHPPARKNTDRTLMLVLVNQGINSATSSKEETGNDKQCRR